MYGLLFLEADTGHFMERHVCFDFHPKVWRCSVPEDSSGESETRPLIGFLYLKWAQKLFSLRSKSFKLVGFRLLSHHKEVFAAIPTPKISHC